METVTFLLTWFCSVLATYVNAKGIFDDIPHIEYLTGEIFENKVLNSDRVWAVAFYDAKEKNSKDAVPEIEKVARILTGIAKIGVVDIAEDEKLAHNYDAKDTPTVILFAADKEKPTLYREKIKAELLIRKIGTLIKAAVRSREDKEANPKKDVVKLTGENFRKKVLDSDGVWFVKYYDPNCVHSKAFAPEYAKAAAALKGVVRVGAANMDVEPYDVLGEPYNIEKVPMVMIFGEDKVTPAEYQGARKATELIDRGLEELERVVKNRLLSEPKEDLYGGEEEDEEEGAQKEREGDGKKGRKSEERDEMKEEKEKEMKDSKGHKKKDKDGKKEEL